MVLKIYRAADAFLYLPTYVAEEYGIFEALINNVSVEFPTLVKGEEGDEAAITKMLEASENANTIAIAIGDPTAFLDMSNVNTEDLRVIGTVINKLSFWAVNHSDKTFETVDKFGKEFDKIIHYNAEFTTGNYLGKRVSQISGVRGKEVGFGEEIEVLNNPDIKHKQLAITADIVSIAKGLSKENNPLKIHYSFAKSTEDEFKKFITTGIITTKKCCEQYGDQLSKIIEGIQKSILMLYSSEKVAQLVCERISRQQKHFLNEAEIKKIIDLIKDEKFYPADLNIDRENWENAVRARADVGIWKNQEKIETSFHMYVDNSFVLKAEKSLARNLGINLETFKSEVEDLLNEKIKPLMTHIECLETDNADLALNKKYFVPWLSKFERSIIKIKTLILKNWKLSVMPIFFVSLIYAYKFFDEEPISKKEILLSIAGLPLGIIVNLLTPYFKHKSKDD